MEDDHTVFAYSTVGAEYRGLVYTLHLKIQPFQEGGEVGVVQSITSVL
jgi:hypothetical protein